MASAFIDIRFVGKEFYPSKLVEKTQLPIQVLAEYGKTSTKGRYKSEPSPYGIGILKIPTDSSQKGTYDLIKKYSDNLLKNKNELLESGVEEIIINIGSPKSSSTEISLAPDILHTLSLLNASVEFYTVDDQEDIKASLVDLK